MRPIRSGSTRHTAWGTARLVPAEVRSLQARVLPGAVAVEARWPERVAAREAEAAAVVGAGAEVAVEEEEAVDVVVGVEVDTEVYDWIERKTEVRQTSQMKAGLGWAS